MFDQTGESNNGAKITADQAATVKFLFNEGLPQSRISFLTGVARPNVWSIVHGRSWRKIAPENRLNVDTSPAPLPTTKLCPSCETIKPLEDFPPYAKSRLKRNSYCRLCKNDDARAKSAAARMKLLESLGAKCACCGEDRWKFLAVDHINGGGAEERRATRGRRIHELLLKPGADLSKYRILCHNCNLARGFYGRCPHEEK